ncbi:MAG: Uncharacterized protein Athens101410_339 [Parcubacteria group bacterium Athens1014_10]|nr:MAG: Uncharacterized protein Athens101410_339 [Parcubacteria group bacterium Athens1014_10]TSD05155.1 MAG: Uncharacterized protein Athens071412_457 [Parcubacteria group bacterium Athens0714_12]
MNQEKWLDLKLKTKEKFGIAKESSEELELAEKEDGTKIMEKKEIIEFESPMGRIKLEKISKPKVIGKKTLYSRRIGSNIEVKYDYSPDEIIHQLKAYKQDNGQWQEITYNF